MPLLLLDDDVADDNSPYVIKGLYRGERQQDILFSLVAATLISGYTILKMPKPMALNNPHDLWGWCIIGFLLIMLIYTLFDAALQSNYEWSINQMGLTKTLSNRFGQKQTSWPVVQIKRLDVEIIGFERGTFMSFLSRQSAPTYYTKIHLWTGKTIRLKPHTTRDAAARELRQISKRWPNVSCETFNSDQIY